MPDLNIFGTIDELLNIMNAIKQVTSERKNFGWLLFQLDETWEYRTSPFSNVCPKCRKFGSDNPFSGPIVDSAFPEKRRLADESVGFFHPEVHLAYPQFRGQCQCRVEFLNVGETLVNRLDGELRSVV